MNVLICQIKNLQSAWPNKHFTFVVYYTSSSNFRTLQYDLYQKLQLQFDVLLMMGAIETRNL